MDDDGDDDEPRCRRRRRLHASAARSFATRYDRGQSTARGVLLNYTTRRDATRRWSAADLSHSEAAGVDFMSLKLLITTWLPAIVIFQLRCSNNPYMSMYATRCVPHSHYYAKMCWFFFHVTPKHERKFMYGRTHEHAQLTLCTPSPVPTS